MLEKDIERILVREVKKAGGRAYKFISPGNDGVPDRLVVLPNRVPMFVELKTETGKLSKVQESQIRFLDQCHQWVLVLYGLSDLKTFFESVGLTDAAERLVVIYGA